MLPFAQLFTKKELLDSVRDRMTTLPLSKGKLSVIPVWKYLHYSTIKCAVQKTSAGVMLNHHLSSP